MGKHNSILNQAYLRLNYWYNPITGEMISRRTNRPTGWIEDGYRHITIKNKDYRVHRLVWMYLHDSWPNGMIDHINGNRLDNSIKNLRDVTARQNAENKNKINAVSGLKGVFPAPKNKWKTAIGYKNKTIYLGTFDTKEEAYEIYCRAAKVFHTHNSHASF